MDKSKSEGSLLDEINFLTNLIQSHQASGPPLQDKHGRSRRTPYRGISSPKMTSTPVFRSRPKATNNMVYRPPVAGSPPIPSQKSQLFSFRDSPLQAKPTSHGGSGGLKEATPRVLASSREDLSTVQVQLTTGRGPPRVVQYNQTGPPRVVQHGHSRRTGPPKGGPRENQQAHPAPHVNLSTGALSNVGRRGNQQALPTVHVNLSAGHAPSSVGPREPHPLKGGAMEQGKPVNREDHHQLSRIGSLVSGWIAQVRTEATSSNQCSKQLISRVVKSEPLSPSSSSVAVSKEVRVNIKPFTKPVIKSEPLSASLSSSAVCETEVTRRKPFSIKSEPLSPSSSGAGIGPASPPHALTLAERVAERALHPTMHNIERMGLETSSSREAQSCVTVKREGICPSGTASQTSNPTGPVSSSSPSQITPAHPATLADRPLNATTDMPIALLATLGSALLANLALRVIPTPKKTQLQAKPAPKNPPPQAKPASRNPPPRAKPTPKNPPPRAKPTSKNPPPRAKPVFKKNPPRTKPAPKNALKPEPPKNPPRAKPAPPKNPPRMKPMSAQPTPTTATSKGKRRFRRRSHGSKYQWKRAGTADSIPLENSPLKIDPNSFTKYLNTPSSTRTAPVQCDSRLEGSYKGSCGHENKDLENRDRESKDRESRDRERRDSRDRDSRDRDRDSRNRENGDRKSRDWDKRDHRHDSQLHGSNLKKSSLSYKGSSATPYTRIGPSKGNSSNATPYRKNSAPYKKGGAPYKESLSRKKPNRRARDRAKTSDYFKNKVWLPAQSARIETEVVFITPESLGHNPVQPEEQPTEGGRLQGHEMKTRQGHRQWVVNGVHVHSSPNKAAKPVNQDRLAEPVYPAEPEKPADAARRLFGLEKKTRQGNKQWVFIGAHDNQAEPLNQDSPAVTTDPPPVEPVKRDEPVIRATPVDQDRPAEAVRLFGHEKKTRQGNKQWVVAGTVSQDKATTDATQQDKPAEPVRLLGHEKKTRQGNKQWVVAGGQSLRQRKSLGLGGREKKTKRGNKQWVLTPRSSVTRRRSKTKQRPSLVSFNGGRYTMDSTGRKLKRLSSFSRSFRVKRLVSFDGGKYSMDATGRKLKRLSTSSLVPLSPAISGYLGAMASSSAKRIKASRVVKRSKAFVWHARMKKQEDRSKQFCLFFNRFGKCNKGQDCPYIHDPDKIAVCTKFLKGTCEQVDGMCPFSHKISKEKMPVCSFFLRGVCSREDCPYLHVSVGKDAKVCPDFLKGYCSRGEKCTMQHTLDCPQFSLTGSCPKGLKCPLRHTKKPKEVAVVSLVKEPRAFQRVRHKQELLLASHLQEGAGSEGRGAGSEEGAGQVAPITTTELEFMPLVLDEVPDFIPL